jgi:hypothetical protein
MIAQDPVAGKLFAYGTTFPADGSVGFAPGCLFLDIDATTEATYWYLNVGTRPSSNFDAIDFNITENAYLSGVTPGTGAASKAVVLDSNGAETIPGLLTTLAGLVTKSATAAAITTTRTLTSADSGGVFSVAKTSAYAITLPTAAAGLKFKFMVLDTGANAVTISSGAAHLYGVADVAGTPVIMGSGANGTTTLSLVATGGVGDWVSFEGIDATHYLVSGACVTAAKITVA